MAQLRNEDPFSIGSTPVAYGSSSFADFLAAVLGRIASVVPAIPDGGLTIYELLDVAAGGTTSNAYAAAEVHRVLTSDGRFVRVTPPASGAMGATKWRLGP